MSRSSEELSRYEQRTGVPLLVVSLVYLGVVFIELIPEVHVGTALVFVDGALWAVFVVDWAYRVFWLAPRPLEYLFRPLCIVDLVVVLSFPVLAVLGTGFLGLARAARVIAQLLRLARGGAQAVRTVGQVRRVLSPQSLKWIVPTGLLFTVLAAVVAWRYETASTAGSIQNGGDAAWWAIMTLLSGDSGNFYPRTLEGRAASLVVIIIGIMVIGWVTASLASVFVEGDEDTQRSEVVERLDAISQRLAAIEARLDSEDSSRGSEPNEVGS